MQRKACVEFIGFTKVRVTTSFKQKEFDLDNLAKKGFLIDLIELKTKPFVDDLKFYTEITDGTGTIEEPYELVIMAKCQENTCEPIGTINAKTKSKVFFVNIP